MDLNNLSMKKIRELIVFTAFFVIALWKFDIVKMCIRDRDVNVVDTPNHPECIRCGACMKACPTNAICYHYGFSGKKQADHK